MPVSLVSLASHGPGTYGDDDTDKVASPAGGMLDAVPSAPGPPRPHDRSFVVSVCEIGRAGIPSEPPRPNAGTILRDRSCCIFRSAAPRFGEIISGCRCQAVHCDIVHWVGSDPKSAGGTMPPASEVSSEDSAPNYFGCTLSLMSAERIRKNRRPLFFERDSYCGDGPTPQPLRLKVNSSLCAVVNVVVEYNCFLINT